MKKLKVVKYAIQFDYDCDGKLEWEDLYKIYEDGTYSMWRPYTREWDSAGTHMFEWIPKGNREDRCWNREATPGDIFRLML